MSRQTPPRLGFFTYLDGPGTQAEIYRQVIERFARAEQVGFDSAWVAQHHFAHHGGLPSPLVFFASVAASIPRIRLGTAIIALSLDDPIRLAEDAAVLDVLHPGRFELGLGTGFATDAVLATFDRAGRDKRELYNAGLERLQAAFSGAALNSDGDVLNPPAPDLRGRIWESPASLERTIEVAKRGNGLLLSRVAIGGGDRPTPEIQVPLVEGYLANLPAGVEPRIGFSRTVYPAWNEATALANIAQGLQAAAQSPQGANTPVYARSLDDQIRHFNIHFGHPDKVIASLQAEPLIDHVTDFLFQLQPGWPTQEQNLEAIELIASHIAPALGWRPAISFEPALTA